MVRIKLLLISAGLSAALALLPTDGALGEGASCAPELAAAGLCAAPPPEASGGFNNGGVDISAGIETGTGGRGPEAGPDGGGDVGVVVDERGGANAPGVGGVAPIVRDDFTVNCPPGSPCDPNLVVRVSDLVNIRPAGTTLQMEPSGWAVVGLPANFIATAGVHIRSGLLLGFPADVRFTPAGFRWDYGDGSSRTSSSGGATWAELAVPEFSETATSHTFATGGKYQIESAVIYTAEYRFAGQGWRSVAGTLAVPAPSVTAVVAQARTVLVDRDCSRNPTGPGC